MTALADRCGVVAAAQAHHMCRIVTVVPRADVCHVRRVHEPRCRRNDCAYKPDTTRCDVYRGPWALYGDAAAVFWRPYLFETVPRDSALANLVSLNVSHSL